MSVESCRVNIRTDQPFHVRVKTLKVDSQRDSKENSLNEVGCPRNQVECPFTISLLTAFYASTAEPGA